MSTWGRARTAIASVRGFNDYRRDGRDGPDVPRTGGSQSNELNTNAEPYPDNPVTAGQTLQTGAGSSICQQGCAYCELCDFRAVCFHNSYAVKVHVNDGRHASQCPGRMNQNNAPAPQPSQQQNMYTGSSNQSYGQSPPANQQYSPPPQAPAPYSPYQPQQGQAQQPTFAPRSYPPNSYGPTQPQPAYSPQYAQSGYTHEPQGYSPEPPQIQRATTWQPGYNTQPTYNNCPRCNGLLHSAGYCPYCNWRT